MADLTHIDGSTDPDFRIYVGEDKTLRFTARDEPGGSAGGGSLQTINTYTLTFQVAELATDSTALITKTTTASTITFPDANTADVAIYDTDTEYLVPGTYWYTLKRTDAGSETVGASGRLELLSAVAR